MHCQTIATNSLGCLQYAGERGYDASNKLTYFNSKVIDVIIV